MQNRYPTEMMFPGGFVPGMGARGVYGAAVFQAAFDPLMEERQFFEDARKMQSYYPQTAQQIQQQVEEACDKMEYEGSIMFDEHPDRLMMRRTAQEITDRVRQMNPDMWEEQEEMLSGQSGGPGRPPRRKNNWLGDLVQVMLADEMHRRRCRHRRCQRRVIW